MATSLLRRSCQRSASSALSELSSFSFPASCTNRLLKLVKPSSSSSSRQRSSLCPYHHHHHHHHSHGRRHYTPDLGDNHPKVDQDIFSIGEGTMRVMYLNKRPHLNALDQEYSKKIYHYMDAVEHDPDIAGACITNYGNRIFSAGADFKQLYHIIKQRKHDIKRGNFIQEVDPENDRVHTIFRRQYELIWFMANMNKPLVSIMDGLAVGTGASLVRFARYPMATSNAVFGLPNCAIGFFPDGGATYYLARLPYSLGMFLALTGYRLRGCDIVYSGICNNFCAPETPNTILTGGSNATGLHAKFMPAVVDACVMNPSEFPSFTLRHHVEMIDRCFGERCVEDIFQALGKERGVSGEFANTCLKLMSKASPTALKVTYHAIKMASQLPLELAMQQEYRVALRMVHAPDFEIGVKSVLIDQKPDTPVWSRSLEQVSQQDVLEYFQPFDDGMHECRLEYEKPKPKLMI